MNLIIVESPTKAKTLSRFLDKKYQIEATLGHIKDLPKSTLGIDLKHNFKPDYQPIAKRSQEIVLLKSLSKKASVIFLASDPDREGEAIASHVKEIVGDGKTKRIVFHEITPTAVLEAIANPRAINHHLVNAQIARRVLDRLVGYQLSPLLWKKVRRGLSAGRVQSVAVRLIVEREREIEKFKAEEYWEIYCDVHKAQPFRIKLVKINDKNAALTTQKQADPVISDLKHAAYLVQDVQKKQAIKRPYPPFTTSTLTQAAARLFGWPAKRTMSTAQRLYEEGLITYHRTDSFYLSPQAVSQARNFIQKEYGSPYLPDQPQFYKTSSRSAQEAHEAIRPTNPAKTAPELQAAQTRLYQLIWKRFLACQMAPSIYDETKIDVAATYKQSNYLLRVTGQIQKFDGWRKLFPKSVDKDIVLLPEVSSGDPLQLIKVIPEQKFTQPPARYNEASLIKTLEKLGIGRPSTYAPTISTILSRNYVEKDDAKFIPTTIGFAVNDFLITNFPQVFDYQFTAEMEQNLDFVAAGSKKWQKIIHAFYHPFEKKLNYVTKHSQRVKIAVEKLNKKCPDCQTGELVIRLGRFGKFISCSRFPDCKHTEKYLEKINLKCPDCKTGEIIVKTTKRNRKFFGCSRYPDCKFASWKNPKLENKKNTD